MTLVFGKGLPWVSWDSVAHIHSCSPAHPPSHIRHHSSVSLSRHFPLPVSLLRPSVFAVRIRKPSAKSAAATPARPKRSKIVEDSDPAVVPALHRSTRTANVSVTNPARPHRSETLDDSAITKSAHQRFPLARTIQLVPPSAPSSTSSLCGVPTSIPMYESSATCLLVVSSVRFWRMEIGTPLSKPPACQLNPRCLPPTLIQGGHLERRLYLPERRRKDQSWRWCSVRRSTEWSKRRRAMWAVGLGDEVFRVM
jgi:hypothetical protein